MFDYSCPFEPRVYPRTEAEEVTLRERNLTLLFPAPPLKIAGKTRQLGKSHSRVTFAHSCLSLLVPIHCVRRQLRCESTVSHGDGFFDNDYHTRDSEFYCQAIKADICPVLSRPKADRFGEVRLIFVQRGWKGARIPSYRFGGCAWHLARI
jgi:hypothetical protein